MKLFILEDNEHFLQALLALVDNTEYRNDYSVFTAYNAFLNMLDESVDCILIDHRLDQEMKAIKLMERIKRKNKDCFIIVMSVDDTGQTVKEYMNKGADKFLIKSSTTFEAELNQFLKEADTKMKEFRDLKRAAKRGDGY